MKDSHPGQHPVGSRKDGHPLSARLLEGSPSSSLPDPSADPHPGEGASTEDKEAQDASGSVCTESGDYFYVSFFKCENVCL